MTQHAPSIRRFVDAHASIDRSDDDARTSVTLTGQFDLSNVSLVRRSLEGPGPHLEVDLTPAAFLDGSTIRALTEAAEERLRTGGSFRIRGVSGFHASLLDRLGLADLLGITEDAPS